MEYTHPVRRRARTLRHISMAAAKPSSWRRGVVMGAYWWTGHANFGDDLNAWLLPRYGIVPVHRLAGEAGFVGIGSVLDTLPIDFSGIVWGAGVMNDRSHPLPRAHVLAVRGPLTRERIGAAEDVAMGDPGLLVERHMKRPAPRWNVGIVPHADHRSNDAVRSAAGKSSAKVRVIDVHQSARRAVREIASCQAIVTTSLHGLITADAFGIPAVWTTMEPALSGGTFKFRDYEMTVTPGHSRFAPLDPVAGLIGMAERAEVAPRERVQAIADDLERAISGLDAMVEPTQRFPSGVARILRSGRE